jgi:hypothetical protein
MVGYGGCARQSGMGYPTKDALDRAKASLEIVTHVTVVALIVLAIWKAEFFIEKVVKTFRQAGLRISEINLGVIKLQIDALAVAQSSTEDLKEARQLVLCQSKNGCSTEQRNKIGQLVSQISELEKATASTQQQLKEAIRTSDEVVRQAQQQVAPVSGLWVAVAGADSTLPGAKDEVRKLSATFPKAEVLFRRSYYLTVIRFDSEVEARAALPALERAVGRDRQPYVRPFNDFCPNATKEGEFTACKTSQT